MSSIAVTNDTKPPTVVWSAADCAIAMLSTIANAIDARNCVNGCARPPEIVIRVANPRRRRLIAKTALLKRFAVMHLDDFITGDIFFNDIGELVSQTLMFAV